MPIPKQRVISSIHLPRFVVSQFLGSTSGSDLDKFIPSSSFDAYGSSVVVLVEISVAVVVVATSVLVVLLVLVEVGKGKKRSSSVVVVAGSELIEDGSVPGVVANVVLGSNDVVAVTVVSGKVLVVLVVAATTFASSSLDFKTLTVPPDAAASATRVSPL